MSLLGDCWVVPHPSGLRQFLVVPGKLMGIGQVFGVQMEIIFLG